MGKCSVPLLTDTEREDILKRRSTAKSNSRIKTDNFPEEFVGTRRNFDNVLKAESKDILGTLIKAMDAVDLARNPVSFSLLPPNFWINENKCGFDKHTIKACVTCFYDVLSPSVSHLTVSLCNYM